MKQTLVTTLLLTSFTLSYSQPLKKGNYQLRFNQFYTGSNSFFDPDEELTKIRTNRLHQTTVAVDYGISDRLTAHVLFPVFVKSVVNNIQYNQSGKIESGGSLSSIGDAEVGLSISLLKQLPFQTIGFVTLGIPLGKKDKVGLDTDLQTGDGEFNQLIGIKLQKYFSAWHVSGYTSFNNRSKEYSNEIRYGFQAGYLGSKFNVTARVNAIESLFDKTAPVSQNGIYSNHRELVSPGIEVMYKLTSRVGILGSSDFIVTGRNTLNAPLLGVGFQLRGK